jgi:hypothetical protein
MSVNTVAMLETGDFLLNGVSSVPDNMSNRHRVMIQKWIDEGNTPEPYVAPEPSWLDKRLANMADGGYGTTGEQFEMIGEQGMDVYQAHIAKVKSDIPKGDS